MCISRVSKRVKEGCGAPRVMGLLFQCRLEMMVQCSPRRLRNKVSQGGISTACFISCVSACVSAFTPHTHCPILPTGSLLARNATNYEH